MKIYKITGSNEQSGTSTRHFEGSLTAAKERKRAMKNDRMWRKVEITTIDVNPHRAGIAKALNDLVVELTTEEPNEWDNL